MIINTPLGKMRLCAENGALSEAKFLSADSIDLIDSIENLAQKPQSSADLAVLQSAKIWLEKYFSSDLKNQKIKDELEAQMPLLRINGSYFQKIIWELLMNVKIGESRSYGELAAQSALKMGYKKQSAQAVGGALKANKIGIFIPCHRILGANKKLVGYAGGLDKKAALLKHENIEFLEN